jgi:DNA gyrase subunit A
VNEVSVIGRNTQGVKVIGVSKGEHLISIEKVAENNEEDASDESDAQSANAESAEVETKEDTED